MAKVPTRSPTHADVELARLSPMGLEVEEIAVDDVVDLEDLIVLAEDRGRPASHYLAALALATDLKIKPTNLALTVQVCLGNCQQYGALDIADQLIRRRDRASITVSGCLDQCDKAPACRVGGAIVAPVAVADLDELLSQVS